MRGKHGTFGTPESRRTLLGTPSAVVEGYTLTPVHSGGGSTRRLLAVSPLGPSSRLPGSVVEGRGLRVSGSRSCPQVSECRLHSKSATWGRVSRRSLLQSRGVPLPRYPRSPDHTDSQDTSSHSSVEDGSGVRLVLVDRPPTPRGPRPTTGVLNYSDSARGLVRVGPGSWVLPRRRTSSLEHDLPPVCTGGTIRGLGRGHSPMARPLNSDVYLFDD